jgi:hypothetical protein
MNQLKHTPSPWFYEQTESTFNQLDILIKSKNNSIGWVYNKESDACLIASAPEMLEGYINIEQIIKGVEIGNVLPEMAVKMIKILADTRIEKATGMSIEEVLQCQK